MGTGIRTAVIVDDEMTQFVRFYANYTTLNCKSFFIHNRSVTVFIGLNMTFSNIRTLTLY